MSRLRRIALVGIPLAILFLLFGFSRASATYIADIAYDFIDNGSNNFTFIFNVFNNSTGSDMGGLDFFMINFDADPDLWRYSDLEWVSDNGWFAEALEYDPAFGGTPAITFADDSFLGSGGGGIQQGNALGGFSVNFDYTGTLGPDEQLFSLYTNFGTSNVDNGGILIDSDGIPGSGDEYWILGEAFGITRYEPSGPAPVPEPATLWLLGLGLGGFFCLKRRRCGINS